MYEYLQINTEGAKIGLFAGIIVVGLMFSFILHFLFSYRHKQKDYQLLQSQKEQIDRQNILLGNALEELKATQSQLIYRERMASLGELTAGIAHEIQNPLNFVNNFSDVNSELVDELQNELKNKNADAVLSISAEIKANEKKINHHGKRADAIIKGMLQHSRSGAGEKELTDINALANEFIKLSYHGFRAKDKSFDATTITDFDNSIQKINIAPQEIGRMLLNLYNNAFYSVAEKKNPHLLKGSEEYEPTVTVKTKAIKPPLGGLGVLISIRDNGMGIAQKIIDKIFQPFFTTKPTGQGTGLGLSLSYDIIKSHGGTIDVQTKEGSYTEFIIKLPI